MRNKFKEGIYFYNFRDKKNNLDEHIDNTLNKTLSLFRWEGLPKTIPQRMLELYLQTNGWVVFMKHGEGVYIYVGGLGGEPDQLYRPTVATIANPAQDFSGNFVIDWDGTQENAECVIVLNDKLLRGILPIIRKYGSELTENELSIWLADILTRAPWLLSAQDEETKASADKFLENIFDGKLGTITDSIFLDGVKEHVLTNSNPMTLAGLIQHNQYIKASLYNELGLNAMQNGMKKEAISDSEEQMNADILQPFVDNMLECRQDGAERLNEFFGWGVSVDFASSWKDNEEESELDVDMKEAEVEETEAEAEKAEAEAEAAEDAGDAGEEEETKVEEDTESTEETEENEEKEEEDEGNDDTK